MNFRHTSRSTNDLSLVNQVALAQSEKNASSGGAGGGGWKPLSNLSLTDLFNRKRVESAEEPHHNEGYVI